MCLERRSLARLDTHAQYGYTSVSECVSNILLKPTRLAQQGRSLKPLLVGPECKLYKTRPATPFSPECKLYKTRPATPFSPSDEASSDGAADHTFDGELMGPTQALHGSRAARVGLE